MTRDDAESKLLRLAHRIGIPPRAVKVRRADHHGMRLSFVISGVTVDRECHSQTTYEANLACLALWLEDLVLNVERGIETFAEAFYNEGAQRIAATDTPIRQRPYVGNKTVEQSYESMESSLARLGLTKDQVKVKVDPDTQAATIRIRLPSGRTVQKASLQQADARRNLAALGLWLQVRAKNFERGIELDMDRLFAANLLPVRGA